MPEIKISKIKARRGTDDQRKTIVFDQGEFAHTTDTNRLYVGDGTTLGGKAIGSRVFPLGYTPASLLTLKSEIGDIVPVNNKVYQLNSADYTNPNSWTVIAKLSADEAVFTYDEYLELNLDSIDGKFLNPSIASNGIKFASDMLQLNYNPSTFIIDPFDGLSITSGGVSAVHINSTALSSGLIGGSGDVILLDIDTNFFSFSGNKLSVNSEASMPIDLRFEDLSSSWFGSGLTYSTTTSSISTILTNVDNNSLVKTDAGVISLSTLNSSGTTQLPQITVDSFGRVTGQTSAIYGTLSGNSALSGFNYTNTLSSIFNGNPAHTINGAIPGVNITTFTALSSDGSVITLSSAGFITFEGNTTTRSGQQVGRFAIPIFAY